MSEKVNVDSVVNNTRNNLAYLLKTGNVSISAMGKLLGVSKAYVSLWLSGERTPSLKALLDTCKIFGVELDDFCFTDMQNSANIHSGNVVPENEDDVLALTMFQSLNAYDRETVLRMMQALCTSGDSDSDFNQTVIPSED